MPADGVAALLAHQGQPIAPHDLLGAWHPDPLVLVGVVALVVLHERGRRPAHEDPRRRRAFRAGVATLAVALLSPLETLSGSLASAHMVQHVLLLVVAAPLLAWSAPGGELLRGLPSWAAATLRRGRRRTGVGAGTLQRSRAPVGRWLAYVAVVWLWHAAVLYDATVRNDLVHGLEHATFLAAAWMVWSSVLGPSRVRVDPGLGLVGVFTLGLQGVFLSVLLTFATSPWYDAYRGRTEAWGLTPLEDQQLAGVVMWVPVGLVHTAIGIGLLATWLRSIDADRPVSERPAPV